MRILIDMDGVICNYKEMHALMKTLAPSLRFPQSGKKFWTSLKPIEGAIEAVNKLRELHDVYILSGPSTRNPASYSGKRIWIEEHFDKDMAERLILCNFKGLVKGDILIDDNLTGKGQEDFEGRQIHFGHEIYPTWKEVLEELGGYKEECVYTEGKDKHGGIIWNTACGMYLQVFDQKRPEYCDVQGTDKPTCYLCKGKIKYDRTKKD